MTDSARVESAKARLARTRLALQQEFQRHGRGEHEPRDEEGRRSSPGSAIGQDDASDESDDGQESGLAGWLGMVRHGVRIWWRYHPAHAVLEMATPVLQEYARKHPVKLVGIAAGAGVVLAGLYRMKLLTVAGVALALAKSSQISGVVLAMLPDGERRRRRR